jgi:hypothetical protein
MTSLELKKAPKLPNSWLARMKTAKGEEKKGERGGEGGERDKWGAEKWEVMRDGK